MEKPKTDAKMPPGPNKEKEVYGFQTVFRELGYYITRKEQYERALKSFDDAIKKTPTDKRALMGRSIARAKAVQYQGALDDINNALELDEGDLVVLAHKALNTYLSCEFENALVQNLRRVPFRKKPDSFVMGVMHCTEAIENCIGERAGRPLRDHFKIIRKLAWKKAREEKKPYEPKDKAKKKKQKKRQLMKTTKLKGLEPVLPLKMKHLKPVEIPREGITEDGEENLDLAIRDSLYSHKSEQDVIPPGEYYPFRPLQKYTSNIENYMAEKYLDKLYLDKIFLKGLKFNSGLSSPNKEGTKKIIRLSKDGYKTLNYKQDLLRTRRPFYFIKYQETSISSRLRMREAEEILKMQTTYSKDAELLLKKIKDAVENEQTRVAMLFSEKLLSMCNKVQKKYLPKRDHYLKEMYRLYGRTFLELKRLNYSQYNWDQVKRIHEMLGVKPDHIPSNDSVLQQFKDVFVDYKKQIAIMEDRLKKATSCEELAWLYHELSRYHIELKHLELGRAYARKCMQEGYRTCNYDWVVNARMLVTKVNMIQHNRNDAKSEINDAIKVAMKMENNKVLLDFLYKTLETIEKIDFGDVHGSRIVEKREKQIISMMADSGLKEDASHLFRVMSTLPPTRRISVMPGVKFPDKGHKYSGRNMSILPRKKDNSDLYLSKKKGKEQVKIAGFCDYLDV